MKNKLKKINKLLLNKKILIPIISILIILIFLLVCYLFIFKPNITLNGKEEIVSEVYNEFKDPGYKITNSKTGCNIKVEGKVDTKKVGTYKIKYTIKRGFVTTTKIRTIKVVDNLSPLLNLNGDIDTILCPNQEYIEEGYTAMDNYDKDITDKVEVINNGNITYKVKDSSGNETTIVRNVIKEDKTTPIISLKGYANTSLIIGTKYYDAGYTVSDNCDTNIGGKVKVSGNVDYNTIGTYYISYSVTDMYGNSNKVTRTITVKEPPPPKNSTIYLTFDDGPSNVTDDVLDILTEEGVKATFFVINRNDSYNYLMQRAVNEGHTVALHGYSHNYRTVYASVDSYFNDINLISDKIYNATGIRSNIIRFVGGSSNTVSNFNPGIMTTLTTETKNRGYKYYDWNVSSNDTTNLSSSEIYSRVISQIGSKSTYIVLMHDYDSHWNTVNAIRDIIRWGKNNGYKFSNITDSTPEIHHTVNN